MSKRLVRLETRNAAHSLGISANELPPFRRRLLAWFRRTKRDLPWRQTTGAGCTCSPLKKKDPYRVWLSEIMLQQTRVATVIPYYQRFLERFPTMQHLARARIASVLSSWAGLGYYSRARNLHRAAQEIVAKHAGQFPREAGDALKLPGIGSYTVAAILSIAYGKPLAALDGNVARVLARLGAVRGDLRQPKRWRRLEQAAGDLLARQAPGDWNEAMMELGATVCTPISPHCEQCPVERWCRARALGLADRIPAARRKASTARITIAAAVLLDPQGRTLLVRQLNGDGAVFSRLWQFPAIEANGNAGSALSAHLASMVRRKSILNAAALNAAMKELPPARHSVTFRDIRLLPFLARVTRLPSIKGSQTVRLSSLDRVAISSATRKIAEAALAAL